MSIGRCWEPEDIHIYWVGQKVHSHFSVTSFKNPNEFFDQPERLYSNVSLTRVQLLCAYVCVFSRSVLSDSLKTPWTVAHQAPLSIEFSSKNAGVRCHFLRRGSSQVRDQTHVSCIGRQSLYHLGHKGSPSVREFSSV